MNFNYSYRAFLITSLLFGSLFLMLWSIKLSSEVPVELENYDVEYTQLEELLEEMNTASTEKVSIQTNRAYNEAEAFLNDLNNPNSEESSTEQKLAEIEAAINKGSTPASVQEGTEPVRPLDAKSSAKSSQPSGKKGANTRTTISYRLVDRKAMALPNPVYTCAGGGKVVINVTVNDRGTLEKANYNRSASTTANGCLIESALEYANSARFSTSAGKTAQLGTITYNFPGQH